MNRLEEIFEKQTGYMHDLNPIYYANGFSWHSQFPYPLNERWAQEGFRLLAWRITEEVFEALEKWDRKDPTITAEDYREEVADVLHFFVELCICAGVTSGEISSGIEHYEVDPDEDYLKLIWFQVQRQPKKPSGPQSWAVFTNALAHAMMQLRQRPWRTDIRLTDRTAFVRHLSVSWFAFAQACLSTGISADGIYNAYFRKKVINQKRVDDAMAGIPGHLPAGTFPEHDEPDGSDPVEEDAHGSPIVDDL